MAIHEIRESITNKFYTTDETQMVMEKICNLKPGVSHTMLNTDFFIDNPVCENSVFDYVTVIVSPEKMILTNESGINQSFSVMSASNPNVLYKAVCKNVIDTETGVNTLKILQEFPNTFLGASPTFEFYNNKLYLYALFSGRRGVTIDNFRVTFYTALQTKKRPIVTQMMGRLQEFFRSQVGRINSIGRTINPAALIGQTFPLYSYGGIRPERMLSGQNFANYFQNKVADRDEELMSSPTTLRTLVSEARTMVSNLDAFGGDLGVTPGPIPDWIRFGLNPGLQSGPIRPQWPPMKKSDSGNTRMY